MAVAEVVAYSYGYSSVIAAATFLGSQELAPAVAHTQEHPEVVWLTVLSAAAGYVSTACVLALVKHYSSAVAELALVGDDLRLRSRRHLALSFDRAGLADLGPPMEIIRYFVLVMPPSQDYAAPYLLEALGGR